jgi:hypothetical protein
MTFTYNISNNLLLSPESSGGEMGVHNKAMEATSLQYRAGKLHTE